MTGAEYIAEFLARIGSRHVFTLTGGACAFMIDAVGRHPDLEVICVQHEQAAAMAADAVWRVDRRLGVTMATSGPGATNLITGIACSFFDSIPVLAHYRAGQSARKQRHSWRQGAPVRLPGNQDRRDGAADHQICGAGHGQSSSCGDELAKAYIDRHLRPNGTGADRCADGYSASRNRAGVPRAVRSSSIRRGRAAMVGEAVQAISDC